METTEFKKGAPQGFALVATLMLMVLLALLAVGLLSLSAVTLRSSVQGSAQAEARANARLALMVALGELQKEMGPDMRVSAEAALFDTNKQTATIDGVAQPHWLASYNSWGSWLNADFTPEGESSLSIQDTYTPKRERMFRRWLLSLPAGSETNVNAASSLGGWDDSNSVVLVGEGSLGDLAASSSEQVTRAYLTSVGERGRNAWWIGPENHKARIDMGKQPRSLSNDGWEVAQGDTAEVGIGVLQGFEALDSDATISDKLITYGTLRPANIAEDKVKEHFFDLTASSRGVIASVKTGQLKKDLSLLFEKENSTLPADYKYNSGDTQEPSIRPMSSDLTSKNPKITNRHFASWTNMRHYYRMYRRDSGSGQGTGAAESLDWNRSQPYASAQVPILYRDKTNTNQWHGDDSYYRLPVLAKLTFIYSLMSERVNPNSTTDLRYRLYLVYTPIYTYWNPYNVELRIPDNTLGCLSSTYQVLPMVSQMFLGNAPVNAEPGLLSTGNAHSFLRSGSSADIIFKPGEIRLFSHPTIGPQSGGQREPLDLSPGFNPMAYGGDRLQLGVYNASQKPGVKVLFGHSYWGGNVGYGNTAGSLCHTPFWLPQGSDRILAFNWNYPVMYQNDWFNLSQTYTSMTPSGLGEVARWVFSDSSPVPVAYAQLVIKGVSQFDYESINWDKDWRSRNWIQAPPFYFGNSLYISEDPKIAHTQRLDNPYVMNFGPMSAAEMPKVVGHIGNSAFLGSGSNPFEKVTQVPALELPTAPVSSLAGFSGMRINPGWAKPLAVNPDLYLDSTGGNTTPRRSFYYAMNKTISYQSGVTGPGIGNSFMHPMLPRDAIYKYFNNSVSADPANRSLPLDNIDYNDNKVFSDYWDHVFLLNDALWDDYFVSSLADQRRPGAGAAISLSENFGRLVAGEELANSRYSYHSGGKSDADTKAELQAADGYLKAAKHLVVEGMFNVNSTSVAAWYALFAGIRERQIVYRDNRGGLRTVEVPSDKRIGLSRFDTAISDNEMDDPEYGVTMPDGSQGWSGVRFLDDEQLQKLADECVKQVKLRGPFLNFSEFINRRLSNDSLGLMGALQSAIDYDDANPESGSINYAFKNGPDFMLKQSDLGDSSFGTPEAAEGSRFAGVPGYVIQSDLLKPIANTLSVRDDTFRIRAYGESLDGGGNVIARAWCEAIVQRMPEYTDPTNDPTVPARLMYANGTFSDNNVLTGVNRLFGRKFMIEGFRWLSGDEI
jgi:Tfp pilus assembly protein PilV